MRGFRKHVNHPRQVTHGSYVAYGHGCRCEPCKHAYRQWFQAYRARPENKDMRREEALKSSYGLSIAEVDAMIVAQGMQCPICRGSLPPHGKRGGRLTSHVDHDHRDGRVRAVLCGGCNQGLGKFADDPELLQRAADYVRSGGALNLDTMGVSSGMLY